MEEREERRDIHSLPALGLPFLSVARLRGLLASPWQLMLTSKVQTVSIKRGQTDGETLCVLRGASNPLPFYNPAGPT